MATNKGLDNIRAIEIISLVLSVIAIISVAVVVCISCTNQGILNNGSTTHTISVYASGTVSGKPAQSTLYVMINGTGNTTEIAVSNLSNSLVAFNESVSKYINYNSSYITTQNYRVYQPYVRNNTTNITYTAAEYLMVTIPNLENLSYVLGAFSMIPNVYVNSAQVEFSDSQKQALTAQAYAKAMSNATAQAQAIAGARDIYMINVTAQHGYLNPYPITTATITSYYKEAPSNPLYYANTSNLTASVNVVFGYRK